MNGQNLETVTSFKYLGSVITDEGSKPEILYRMVQTTAALTNNLIMSVLILDHHVVGMHKQSLL